VSVLFNNQESSLKGLIFLFVLFGTMFCLLEWSFAGQHCGAENDWRSQLVPDYWPPRPVRHIKSLDGKLLKPVRFYKACKRHDDCYDTYGKPRKSCDEKFYEDMKTQCCKVYGKFWELPQKKVCEAAAFGYYQAVVKNGEPAYLSAQKAAACQEKTDANLQAVKK
jgi:hypothetical protein